MASDVKSDTGAGCCGFIMLASIGVFAFYFPVFFFSFLVLLIIGFVLIPDPKPKSHAGESGLFCILCGGRPELHE